MNAAVELDTVSKVYRRYGPSRRIGTLKSALLGGKLINAAPSETLQAVDEVSLRIPQGAAFGIVGRNGSGKSTLLKLMAGITRPTSGSVQVRGRVSALIELGAGFHPEISGRENVFINGVMLGLTRREIARRFDEIVEFAEMADFIDAPVRTYSSGMYMRLGFAVAVHVDAEVLLVDEVLAVGDERFSLKCLDKFAEYKRHGKTTVLVTHGLAMVERFCDEALWLDAGKVRTSGDPRRVLHAYIGDVETEEEHELARADQKAREAVEPAGDGRVDQDAPAGEPEQAPQEEVPEAEAPPAEVPEEAVPESEVAAAAADGPEDMFKASAGRWGDGPVRIEDVRLEDDEGPGHLFQSGARLAIRMRVSASEKVTDFVFGVSIFNAAGVCCYGTNTDIEQYRPVELAGAGEVVFVIDSLDLVEGTYKLDVAAHRRDGVQYDYHRLLYTFRVKSQTRDAGIYRPAHAWTFTPNIRFEEPGS